MVTWLKGRAEYAKLIEEYDTFLFDCDGVLWNGEHVIQGAAEVIGYLRSKRRLTIREYKVVNQYSCREERHLRQQQCD